VLMVWSVVRCAAAMRFNGKPSLFANPLLPPAPVSREVLIGEMVIAGLR